MKVINASVVPSSVASIELAGRRAGTWWSTSVLKRMERRKSRRQLDAQLHHECYDGVHRDFGKAIPAAPEVLPSQAHLVRYEPMFPAVAPTKFKEVTVTRKRACMRPLVETLMVPA